MPNFRIEQYNTHLFVGTIVPKTFEDEERRKKIVWKLFKTQADVVCLNEVWSDDSKEEIVRQAGARYPHHFYPTKSDAFKLGSGLLLLSKIPIARSKFTRFDKLAGWDADAEKGFVTADLVSRGSTVIRLIITHTQADNYAEAVAARRANIAQICAEVRTLSPEGSTPVAVVGDLNVIAEYPRGAETREYETTKSAFDDVGLSDAYRQKHPEFRASPGFTYNGFTNKLIGVFAPEDKAAQQRLDYMFINSKFSQVTVSNARVSRAYLYSSSKANQLMDLSDHYPLIFDLQW